MGATGRGFCPGRAAPRTSGSPSTTCRGPSRRPMTAPSTPRAASTFAPPSLTGRATTTPGPRVRCRAPTATTDDSAGPSAGSRRSQASRRRLHQVRVVRRGRHSRPAGRRRPRGLRRSLRAGREFVPRLRIVRAATGATFYAPVEGELRELERRLLEVGRGAHPVFRDAVAHLFTTPGKLLRPTLVFLSSKFGPGEDREVVLNLAESLELVHTASLVHDDVVDRAGLRRNVQTINARWNNDVALIVGDYLFAKAYALAAVLPKPEVIAIVAQTVFALCDGELGEITATPKLPTEAEYLDRIELKTASLYAACSQGAALLADAEPDHVAALGAFGTSLGMAFQITDDVLDLVGDETDFGKTVGRDLLEGMPTLPMIYAVAERDGTGGELEARILAPAKSEDDVRLLLAEIRSSSGPERARQRALAFHDAALRALDRLPARAERDALRDAADFVVSRVR